MNKRPVLPLDFSACLFSLHHQISYINGADAETPLNVVLKQCAKKVGINRMFEQNNLTYLLETTQDIKEGEYLSLGYDGQTLQGYFEIHQSLALCSVVYMFPGPEWF